jgi:beta-glucosidase
MKPLFSFLILAIALVLGANAAPQPAKPFDPALGVPKHGNARFYELHSQHLKRSKEPMQLLFLGDSITEGWTKAPEVWKANFEPYQAANFGIGGDRTEHVIWRIEDGVLNGIHPKVVVLMLGTNNSSSQTGMEIAAADKRIIELIRAKLPETKVLLLAIFPRGPRKGSDGRMDDGVARMKVIHEANQELAKLDDGKQIRFLDIGARFLGSDGKIPDEIMPDQLHPGVAGYKIWADAMRPLLDEMMR